MAPICILAVAGLSAQTPTHVGKFSTRAKAAVQASSGQTVRSYWLFLDEGCRSPVPIPLTEHARKRRGKSDPNSLLLTATDYPVSQGVMADIAAAGVHVRRASRWLNAVSVEADRAQLDRLASMSVVRSIDLVTEMRAPRPVDEPYEKTPVPVPKAAGLSYGRALFQNEFIRATKLHQAGFLGKGVLIAMLDTGFKIGHSAFDSTAIAATWDFINNDASVDEPDCPADIESFQQSYHGTLTLGVIASNVPDSLVGVAPKADFILAKTEISCGNTEIKVEEDNWVAAAEWADSIGADIISSSLGYSVFTDSGSYTVNDLNGHTALVTIAAEMAASKNILVVVAAGNERGTPWNRITAPADGDSVLAVGAVDGYSQLAGFSSPGPTADGRIKPDIVTLGVGVWTAHETGGWMPSSGTSLATPLVAGGAALALEIDPSLTAQELLFKIRRTGTLADHPNNDLGYGVYNAARASTIIHIDPINAVWLPVGRETQVNITTSGIADTVPALSAPDIPAWAQFTDNGDGTGRLTLQGMSGNPAATSIALVMDVDYFKDTSYVEIVTYGDLQNQVSAGPNPFSDSVTFFVRPQAGRLVSVSVFNAAGEMVWERVNNPPANADIPMQWYACNKSGERVSAGVYLVYIQTDRQSYRLKLLKSD